VSQIAAMAGFGSAQTLRRNFEKHAGTTPAAYRATFRASSGATGRATSRATESAGSVGRLA
jgi:AraC-like DNA-binding protein